MTYLRKSPGLPPGADYLRAHEALHKRTTNSSCPAIRSQPSAELLPLLSDVRSTGDGRWIARCPAHEDKRPSLSIRELDDGRLLIHDFGGCEVLSVLRAVGLSLSDLFPDGRDSYAAPHRPRVPASDILKCIAHEAVVIAIAAGQLCNGETLSDADYGRLQQAAGRILAALDQGGIRHAA